MPLILLVVEDNQDLREALRDYFTGEGYKVFACDSAEAAQPFISQDIGAAIIDINLPGASGFELVQEIRAQGHQYPLIALTARDTLEDKLHGFDTGLSDYVVKPFSLAELSARIRAHLLGAERRYETTKHLKLHAGRREVLVSNRPITLTGTEFRLLESLVRHNGTIVTTDDLIEHAWGAADLGSDPPVRIHMRNLRKKLGDDSQTLIKTVSGLGYMLDD